MHRRIVHQNFTPWKGVSLYIPSSWAPARRAVKAKLQKVTKARIPNTQG